MVSSIRQVGWRLPAKFFCIPLVCQVLDDVGSVVMKERLQKKRLALVLDDEDDLDQLKSLPADAIDLGLVSATRDKQLLRSHGTEKIYKVKELEKRRLSN